MDSSQHEAIVKALNWRYATKKFDAQRKISDKDWQVLEESLRLAPSSFGLQPWRFVVVKSPEVKKKLSPASWNQPQIESCSHLVVITHLTTVSEDYITKYVAHTAQVRGVPKENLKGYQDMMVGAVVKGPSPMSAIQPHWTARQAYIAAGTYMLTAALLQIDVCPMEGIDSAQYNQILDLKGTPYSAVAVLASGYRDKSDETASAKKVRFARADVVQVI